MNKKCYNCKQEYPLTKEYFYTNKTKKDGFGDDCKSCRKAYQKSRNQTMRDEKKQFIIDRGLKCESCGIEHTDHRFFDLDHKIPFKELPHKSRWFPRDKDNLQVLCPNCHRLKCIKEGFGKRLNE
jgi:predicted HNH restriction endonuclease